MMTKLPRWVEVGGFGLAAIAGAVNAIGLLGFKHQAVSHLTGTSTLFSVSIVESNAAECLHLFLILLSFVIGAMLSGFIVDNVVLRLTRRYSTALAVEAGLLVLAMIALENNTSLGHYLASAACGMQNGLASTFSGAVVRTTHVSGLFTDLGTMMGTRLRGHRLDSRRLLLYSLLIAGFVFGGSIGALGYYRFQFRSLLIPAVSALMFASLCWIFAKGNPSHSAT